MKQRIQALVVTLLLLLLLAGCSSENGPATPQDDSDNAFSPTVVSDAVNTPDDTLSTAGIQLNGEDNAVTRPTGSSSAPIQINAFDFNDIPDYKGSAYVTVNGNYPYFKEWELSTNEFEIYHELDTLGRCGTAYANVSPDSMPTEERGSIGQVKPSGWHTVKYDCVDGKYLYNRCHLIGYQLTAENANTKNLITGTRYLNIEGMLPFENMVADYVKETENHVAYRVTPVYDGENLLADGVLMEGYSVEDQGSGICFCIFAYNVQPGITINYATGDSQLAGEDSSRGDAISISTPSAAVITPDNEIVSVEPTMELPPAESSQVIIATYIANTNTKRFTFHLAPASGR